MPGGGFGFSGRNGISLPLSITNISGLGTGVQTALQVAVGSAGAVLINGGVLGTPSSGTLTNATGYTGANLVLTDVTTNDTSTSKHGFFPKLTINSMYYVNNSGTLVALTAGASGTVLAGNGVTAAPTWTVLSTGITVGTTTITSGTDTRIPFNDGGIYSENANLSFNKTTSALNLIGGQALWQSAATSGGSLSVGNRIISGIANVNVGCGTYGSISGNYNTAIGEFVAGDGIAGNSNVFVGRWAGRTSGGSSNQIVIGSLANRGGTGASNTLIIGGEDNSSTFVVTMSANDAVIGSNGASGGYQQFYFGQGKIKASPSAITFNVTGGSGTDNAGSNFILAGGKGAGAGAPGSWIAQTSTTLGTGTTLQSLVSRLTISGGAVTTDASTATWADKLDFVFNTGTGTKFGTATTQKLSFWNATPIVQPSGATQAAPAAYATGVFGLDSNANMQALYDLVVAMRTALVDAGIMKGSA